jgi:hypothetical protein
LLLVHLTFGTVRGGISLLWVHPSFGTVRGGISLLWVHPSFGTVHGGISLPWVHPTLGTVWGGIFCSRSASVPTFSTVWVGMSLLWFCICSYLWHCLGRNSLIRVRICSYLWHCAGRNSLLRFHICSYLWHCPGRNVFAKGFHLFLPLALSGEECLCSGSAFVPTFSTVRGGISSLCVRISLDADIRLVNLQLQIQPSMFSSFLCI